MPSRYTQWMEASRWADLATTTFGPSHELTIEAIKHREYLARELAADRGEWVSP